MLYENKGTETKKTAVINLKEKDREKWRQLRGSLCHCRVQKEQHEGSHANWFLCAC